MTQKQLNTIILATFILLVGIVIAFAVGDMAKRKVSNPVEKALQGQQQPKK